MPMRGVALLAMLTSRAWAQDATTLRDMLRPRATLRTAVWTSSRTVDNRGPLVGSAMWAEVAPRFSEDVDLRAAGWLGAGGVAGRSHTQAALRELYIGVHRGAVDVRLGKQITAWGRADAVNPTDNLSPDDLTLLVVDDDDQKTGVSSVRVSLDASGTMVTGLWLTDFHGNTLPVGRPPPGTELTSWPRGDVAAQGALRVERSGGRVDWSLSYFSGFDLTPDIAPRGTVADPKIELSYHRLHVLGVDGATVLGRFGVRAEAAWIRTEDATGHDAEIKNATVFAVIGADRTFGPYLNVNLQYLVRWVQGFTPAETEVAHLLARISQQQRRIQHGATLRIANRWWHETLDAEVAAVFLGAPWQLAVRPRVAYALTDRWQVEVGADLLDGRAGTLFHELRWNSLAFCEVRLGL